MLFRAFIVSAALTASASAATKLDFNRDIRPIISENCFSCHGPDEKTREGGLRLDLAEATAQKAFEIAERRSAIDRAACRLLPWAGKLRRIETRTLTRGCR